MKLIKNSGSDRVVDELRRIRTAHLGLDVASSFSLHAFDELRRLLDPAIHCRLVLAAENGIGLELLGPGRRFAAIHEHRR